MPYGKEAKQELTKLVEGKCLRVLVYGEDRYNRCVGDLYCNGKFIQVTLIYTISTLHNGYRLHVCGYVRTGFWFSLQEAMLKKGFAWHYTAYDKRPELSKVSYILTSFFKLLSSKFQSKFSVRVA